MRILIVSLPTKLTARSLFIPPTPLLEKESSAGATARLFNLFDPFNFHRSGLRTGFPANDGPMYPTQIKRTYGAN